MLCKELFILELISKGFTFVDKKYENLDKNEWIEINNDIIIWNPAKPGQNSYFYVYSFLAYGIFQKYLRLTFSQMYERYEKEPQEARERN